MNLAADKVHVWFAYAQLLDDASVRARFEALLSPDERERRDRMKFERGRREQLLTRGMLRELLSLYSTETAPAAWRFVHGESGRPSLAPPFDATGLHFNVAHSDGLVAVAVGRMPHLGVDVESESRKVNLSVAERYFSAGEVASLQALPPQHQPRLFLRLWTLKEAYLKATGTGVAGGLGSMSFRLLQDGVIDFQRDDDPHAKRWLFREFNPPGYVLALACLDTAAQLPAQARLHEYRAHSGQEQRTQA